MKVVNFLRGALTLAITVALLLFTVSCDDPTEKPSADAVTFTDALGEVVTVSRKPKRVAALLGSFADVWVLSGGELCAAAEDAWEDFDLELDGAVNLGGAHSPSLELLVASDPDFVIASASTASNVEMRDTLISMGIAVAYFDVDSFDDYLDMLGICTSITEREDLYEINGLRLKTEIDNIKETYTDENIPTEERRILLLRAATGFVKAKGSAGTVLGEMLADMGCINIADSDVSLLDNLSVEAVIREEPYHVFVVAMGSDTDKALASFENMIKENPAWSTLRAISEGRLHVMDKSLFNLKPNDRWAQAYGILYEKLTEK